jgi:hypothetical protein
MGVSEKSAVKIRRSTINIGIPTVVYIRPLAIVLETIYPEGEFLHQLPSSAGRRSMG